MKVALKTMIYSFAGLASLFLLCANAYAGCGFYGGPVSQHVKPAAWHPNIDSTHFMRAALFTDDDNRDRPSIVGMWHVIFTAHTINGTAIPPDSYPMIDNALVVFHSDQTEIMESARPAQDGNFCMGVWEKTGARSYYLNHLPWLGNDTANAPGGIGNPTAGAQIIERLTVNEEGNKYSGSFSLVAYNLDGSKAITFTGVVVATRITPSTPFSSLF
jgi:hypothetical protein